MYRHRTTRAKSSLSIFAQKYLHKCEDLSYKISIFPFTKIFFEQRYLELCPQITLIVTGSSALMIPIYGIQISASTYLFSTIFCISRNICKTKLHKFEYILPTGSFETKNHFTDGQKKSSKNNSYLLAFITKRESGDNKLDLLVLYPHNLFLFPPVFSWRACKSLGEVSREI